MIVDAELAAAIEGRPHWRIEGDTAVYAPPGSDAVVRVRPLSGSPARDRYHAAVIRSGVAQASVTERSAAAAIAWSERRQLA